MSVCYCGSMIDFSDCCQPLLENHKIAPTAEALMRSRYTAFVLKDISYIMTTTDPEAREQFDLKANKDWADSVNFTKLEVIRAQENASKARVEFKATFTDIKSGQEQIHHEMSQFRHHNGHWYYTKGKNL